jgi:hypothetical protein
MRLLQDVFAMLVIGVIGCQQWLFQRKAAQHPSLRLFHARRKLPVFLLNPVCLLAGPTYPAGE